MKIIPQDKMQRYLKYCQGRTATVLCDCNKVVEVSMSPYCYDEENNDIYFASICPECGHLIITKE